MEPLLGWLGLEPEEKIVFTKDGEIYVTDQAGIDYDNGIIEGEYEVKDDDAPSST